MEARHRHEPGDVPQRPELATQAEIDAFELVGNADCVNNPTFDVATLNFMWMTGVKRPGYEDSARTMTGRSRSLS